MLPSHISVGLFAVGIAAVDYNTMKTAGQDGIVTTVGSSVQTPFPSTSEFRKAHSKPITTMPLSFEDLFEDAKSPLGQQLIQELIEKSQRSVRANARITTEAPIFSTTTEQAKSKADARENARRAEEFLEELYTPFCQECEKEIKELTGINLILAVFPELATGQPPKLCYMYANAMLEGITNNLPTGKQCGESCQRVLAHRICDKFDGTDAIPGSSFCTTYGYKPSPDLAANSFRAGHDEL